MLDAFRRIGKFRESLGDFRKKSDTILLHQLSEEGSSDGRTSQSGTEFCKNGNFDFGTIGRGGHDMAQRDRILDRLTQTV